MKFPIYSIVVSILVTVGFAQDTRPVEPKQPTENTSPVRTPTQDQQNDRQPSPTQVSTPGKTSATNGAQSSDQTTGQSTDRTQEMKTQTYSGTLVDASCAGTGSDSSAPASTSSTTPTGSSAGSTGSTSSPNSTRSSTDSTGTSSGDRTSVSGSSQGCALSAGATRFALQMKDGQTVRFDDVGNTRALEALNAHKKWSDSATANKPLRVKVSAVLSGDKLTVMSIN